MPTILAIDMAERHSAACVLTGKQGARPEVAYQSTIDVGSRDTPAKERRYRLRGWLRSLLVVGLADYPVPETAYVEDIHPFAVNPKPALRLQGVLEDVLDGYGVETQYVKSNDWQKHFGYKKQKGRSSKGWAKEKAVELDHPMPEWASGKQLEDLRDAFLIASYVWETL